MCDYSLHSISSRPAKVGDKMFTTEFVGTSNRGFAAVGERGIRLVIHDVSPKMAVCLLPGTELAFDEDVRYGRAFSLFGKARVHHRVARFRQVIHDQHVRRDALEFPDGRSVNVTRLACGQTVRVLQLPVETEHSEPIETGRVTGSSGSRVSSNRISLTPGASILMPNLGTLMLWQALRRTSIELSIGLKQPFRRLKAHRQRPVLGRPLPADVDAKKINVSFNDEVPTSTLPKKLATWTFEGKIEVNTAA
jgi:hypothetical protein